MIYPILMELCREKHVVVNFWNKMDQWAFWSLADYITITKTCNYEIWPCWCISYMKCSVNQCASTGALTETSIPAVNGRLWGFMLAFNGGWMWPVQLASHVSPTEAPEEANGTQVQFSPHKNDDQHLRAGRVCCNLLEDVVFPCG